MSQASKTTYSSYIGMASGSAPADDVAMYSDSSRNGAIVFKPASAANAASKGVIVDGAFHVTGALTVVGDLTVQGTTTTVESTTVAIADKNFELAKDASTDTAADGGGLTLKGSTDKTFNWVNSSDAWTSSEHMDLASGKAFHINGTKILDATSLHDNVKVSNANLSSVDTDNLTEGSNLYYTTARWDTKMSAADTDDLSEGSSNLYHTTARARAAVSADADTLSYNNSTGVMSVVAAALTASARVSISDNHEVLSYDNSTGQMTIAASAFTASARSTVSVTNASGDGSMSYNKANGVLTYTGPSATEVRTHFAAGDGLAVSNGSFSVNVDDSSIETDSDTLRVKALGITNDMLAGSIANAKLSNSTVSFGGVSLALGASDATPAFDLTDATDLPVATGLTAGTFAAGTWSFAGSTISNLGQVTTANIDGGTLDGVTIGGASPAAATVTTLTANAGGHLGNQDSDVSGVTGSFSIWNDDIGYNVLLYNGNDDSLQINGTTYFGYNVNLGDGVQDITVNVGNDSSDTINIKGATALKANVTLEAGNALDLSAGTLTLANDQISGDKINGGTIGSVTISQLAGAMDANSNNITNVNTFEVDGTATFNGNVTLGDNSGDSITFNGTVGNFTAGTVTGTEFVATSDARLKSNIQGVTNAMDVINSIQGVEYDLNENGQHSMGILAQDLIEVAPALVKTRENGNYAVNYSGLSAFFVEAIKEQQAQIEDLKNTVKELSK